MYLLGATVQALADKAKGVGCIDEFVSQVQPVTVMKGEKFSRANEVLVKALTGIYFCSFFFLNNSQCPSPPLTMWLFPSGGG